MPIAKAPAGPQTTTMAVEPTPQQQPGGPTRNVRARPGDMIRTPGGAAPPPVVAPEEAEPVRAQPAAPQSAAPQPAPPQPGPRTPGTVQPVQPSNALTEEGEDDEEFEDEEEMEGPPNASTGAAQEGAVSLRLTGLQTAMRGRPMVVSVLGTGAAPLSSATVAISFDSQLLRVAKVESTGVFDGKVGAKIPYELRDGMLVLSLGRDQGAAPAPVNGQLATVTFEVVGTGPAMLAIVPDASSLIASSGTGVPLRAEGPLRVTTR